MTNLPGRVTRPSKELRFLASALRDEGTFQTTAAIRAWLDRRRDEVTVRINQIPFSGLRNWRFDDWSGNLVHESGRFFAIEGLSVKTNWGPVAEWQQPIIHQPEVGLLGIIAKEFQGVLHFLMQAKIEPGNINFVQVSPTLQATRSNYSRVHGGNRPDYLEYFTDKTKATVLLDQLQSEQGARFLRKRNRNIIVETSDDVPVHENFCWMTLGQLKRLVMLDNLVNMNTRTVLSGIPFGSFESDEVDLYRDLTVARENSYPSDLFVSMLDNTRHLNSTDSIISWITNLKSIYDLRVERMPLRDVRQWRKTEFEIAHETTDYFSVIAADVEIENREVSRWTQPLLKSSQEGLIAFIIKKIQGIYHFLVQAKLESGNFDIIEMAPTVQCITGNYRHAPRDYWPPFLEYVLQARPEQIRSSVMQSEEGGRFFHEQNRNMIVEAGEDLPVDVPENYYWMTLSQLKTFIKYNNYLNMQARGLLASVSFLDY